MPNENKGINMSGERYDIGNLIRNVTGTERTYFSTTIGSQTNALLDSRGIPLKHEKIGEGFIIPYDKWIVSLILSDITGQASVEFEFKDDYVKRKLGEKGDESFDVVNDKLQPGTIQFLRFMKDLLQSTDGQYVIRMSADERRMSLYEHVIKPLQEQGKRIILVPRTIVISESDLMNS